MLRIVFLTGIGGVFEQFTKKNDYSLGNRIVDFKTKTILIKFEINVFVITYEKHFKP